jgi:hypothetical protein
MRLFKRNRESELGRELRAARPEAREELVTRIAGRLEEAASRRRVRMTPRVAIAGGLATAMLVAAASVGGFGYAATAAQRVADGVKSVLASNGGGAVGSNLNASGDQYRPGYGWGDPNHTHSGPPGLTRKGGDFAPPLVANCSKGATAHVKFSVVLDEQADLTITMFGQKGKKLPFAKPDGGKMKKLHYRVLVPRALKLNFAVPCSLVDGGQTYLVHLQATDPDGNSSTLDVPFRVHGPTA